jgi:2-phospho-L-lactate guanylyltransferase
MNQSNKRRILRDASIDARRMIVVGIRNDKQQDKANLGVEYPAMKIWAIVPVKPFVRAKSRLAKVLAAEQRQALAEHMFRHSVDTLIHAPGIAGVTVLSRDSKALAIAHDYGVHTIQESGTPNLNASLQRAAEIMRLEGWSGILILPADLPLVIAEDIEQIVYLGRYLMTAVVVPDRNEDDTNALLVKPAGLIPFSFGPGSFQRHVVLAEKAGATVQPYRSERIGLDIDTPIDLEHYRRQIGDTMSSGLAGEAYSLPAHRNVPGDAIHPVMNDIEKGDYEHAVPRMQR